MPRLRSTSRTLLPVVLVGGAGALIGPGCGSSGDAVEVGIVTRLVTPRGLLDRAVRVEVRVIEGDVTCDPATGLTAFPNGVAAAREIGKRDLGTSGCAPGVRFCGALSVARSTASRLFAVSALDAAAATVAAGCASSVVDGDVAVTIPMVRFLPPANCGDRIVQPTEQCDEQSAEVCDAGCQSNEVLLSIGSKANGTQTGAPTDKGDPTFVWPSGTGDAGRFFAFFTDRAVASGNVEVALRALSPSFTTLATPPALAGGSIYLPNGAAFPPPPSPRQQSFPSVAALRGKFYVAFQDDDTQGANGLDIHLRSMDAALVAEQGAAPLGINGVGGAGEANIQREPSIAAGPKDRLLLAWEDAAQGKIAGRTLAPPGTLGSQNEISTLTGNRHVSLAATKTGWVAVWESGTGIKLRVMNEDGTPQGTEQTVNEAGAAPTQPRVASLPDGRFAVVWTASSDIYFQRYDALGARLSGDQAGPLNDKVTEGSQSSPAIGSIPTGAGAYAVAWVDGASGHVRARFLGGTSSFAFNNVNGQASEFPASRVDGRTRANPSVAVGGAGFVAIGWEDRSAGGGIVARRFPLPAE